MVYNIKYWVKEYNEGNVSLFQGAEKCGLHPYEFLEEVKRNGQKS